MADPLETKNSTSIQDTLTKVLTLTRNKLHQFLSQKSVDPNNPSFYGRCTQASLLAAYLFCSMHPTEFKKLFIVSSYQGRGHYNGPYGDPKFIGHMVCVCQGFDDQWYALSPQTDLNTIPNSTSIISDMTLSGLFHNITDKFGGLWPDEQDILSQYQKPIITDSILKEPDVDQTRTTHAISVLWAQRESSNKPILSFQDIPVFITRERPGTEPMEFLARQDFHTIAGGRDFHQ